MTDKGKNVRHFRHSSYEKSKSCPERTSGGCRFEYNSNEHELPIRIVGITSNSFYFELGLIRIPENLLNENIKIEIKPDEFNSKPFLYSKERINYNSISYVPIGDTPCTKYYINVLNCKNEIYDYWSREIKGIDSSGTIFETPSERKLPVDSDIKNENEVLSLSDSVILLPAYEYHINDVIVDDETIFYNKVCAGKPSKLYRVKNSIDIVKNIVLDNISWNNYKTRGIAKAEYRCFKELIASVSSKNIINTIASECNCNTAIAEELLEQFISQISDYINEECLEDKIIESALKSNESLMNRAKMLITEDWKSENNELISDAEAKLNEIIKEKNEAYEELKTIQSIHTKLKEETDSFSSLLAEKEKLALDVETAVENKINSAKLKVADFIANMAFVSPSMIKPAKSSEITSTVSLEVIEIPFDKSEADEHHNWREIVDTLDFELGEAGVCSEYSRSLATYLCASFIAREPLFLIGPNTDAIAEAFTISLFGANLSVLNCGGTFTKSFFDNSEYYSKPVVMIKNIISSRWIEYLPELLTYSEPNPYCFLTHPYSEDIQVEPKSLYNYVLPLFTEFFVDRKSKNKFCGGYSSSDFKQVKTPLPEKNKRVSALSANNLIKTKINQILANMHYINPDLKSDYDEAFVFGALQYAYATLDYDFIKNVIKDNNPPISKRLKNELKCILGDIE